MKKYYCMAIGLNNSYAMYNLGDYYQYVEKNYEEMKKYYMMAIELNHIYTINNSIKNNYYYDSAIKNAINNRMFIISKKEIECPILLEKVNECYKIKNCGHEFSQGITNLTKCPLCRKEFG